MATTVTPSGNAMEDFSNINLNITGERKTFASWLMAKLSLVNKRIVVLMLTNQSWLASHTNLKEEETASL